MCSALGDVRFVPKADMCFLNCGFRGYAEIGQPRLPGILCLKKLPRFGQPDRIPSVADWLCSIGRRPRSRRNDTGAAAQREPVSRQAGMSQYLRQPDCAALTRREESLADGEYDAISCWLLWNSHRDLADGRVIVCAVCAVVRGIPDRWNQLRLLHLCPMPSYGQRHWRLLQSKPISGCAANRACSTAGEDTCKTGKQSANSAIATARSHRARTCYKGCRAGCSYTRAADIGRHGTRSPRIRRRPQTHSRWAI